MTKDPYNYEAFNEGFRIKELSAFNIPSAIKRRKVNQHMTVYHFKDGSELTIYHAREWALAHDGKDNRFNASFTLRINARGN